MVLDIVRDLSIVLLAVASLVIAVLLAVLIVQVKRLVVMLREEVAPILEATQDTATRVGGTVNLVSDTVVSPLIKVNSMAVGVRQALGVLRGTRAASGQHRTPREGEHPLD
ncbi:MAG: hypothetical protein ACOX2L_08050 [Anaerolineae bacterium]|nr:hypothetical protein [Chloroflexota bacterium]